MRPEMCIICNDASHYNTIVSQTRNIVFQLRRFVSNTKNERLSREEEQFKQNLNLGNQHFHFMCGHCFKINESEMRNLEKEMNDLLVEIAIDLTQKDNRYYETLRLLQGAYSTKYHLFESFCLRKFS